MRELTPKEIVGELDKYIIGQKDAKRSVAVALRNRYRRGLLTPEEQEEIIPKNIIMIGPTGVGKTEIARRLARLVHAPFIKVEATKYTEVGYVGRDVESMIRDLAEVAFQMVSREMEAEVMEKAHEQAERRLLDYLAPLPQAKTKGFDPFSMFMGNAKEQADEPSPEEKTKAKEKREIMQQKLERYELEDEYVEIEISEKKPSFSDAFANLGMENMSANLDDVFKGIMPDKVKKRRLKVSQAREALADEEATKLVDQDELRQEAIRRTENKGIVFIDEIDKIAAGGKGQGIDVSREGVQRDILPIVEGSVVSTKYGNVRTDHILFIAAGAFHISKPSDLIPELQGRFPIRVELDELKKEDFVRILKEPDNSLVKQYVSLMRTEGTELSFTDEAIEEIADVAYTVNSQLENIGARRLHTILEKLLEEIMFETKEDRQDGEKITIDKGFVERKLQDISREKDLSHYIL